MLSRIDEMQKQTDTHEIKEKEELIQKYMEAIDKIRGHTTTHRVFGFGFNANRFSNWIVLILFVLPIWSRKYRQKKMSKV